MNLLPIVIGLVVLALAVSGCTPQPRTTEYMLRGEGICLKVVRTGLFGIEYVPCVP